jgi:enediyne biosynthesis protein E4
VKQYKQGVFFSDNFVGENSWNGYERKCLFANIGDGQFMDVARPTGTDSIRDGRGVAVADLNGDGKLDLVMNNNNAPPTLYLNEVRMSGNDVELKLVGTQSNRDAIGARVRLTIAGKTMTRQVEAGSGYASEMMLPVHFGLGSASRIEAVEITWPSGLVQRFAGTQTEGWVNGRVRIEEGAAEVIVVAPAPASPRIVASRPTTHSRAT